MFVGPQEVSPVAGVWKQTNHSHMSHILTFSHVSHVSHVSHSQILIVHTCSTTTGGPPAHLHIRCFGNWPDFRITATYSQLIVGHIYILRLEGGIPHIPNGLSRLKPGVSKQETLSKQTGDSFKVSAQIYLWLVALWKSFSDNNHSV